MYEPMLISLIFTKVMMQYMMKEDVIAEVNVAQRK